MFSEGVERALAAALEAHRDQRRKGGSLPYAIHPVHVALMLAKLDASDEIVQAGLLHDVVEDVAGWDLARVRASFGDRVADVVAELTEDKRLSWYERKTGAIEKAGGLSAEAALIMACDKLHNLESLRLSLEQADDPALVWAHFRGGREGTIRMAAALVEALAARVPAALADALRSALAAIRDR